MPPPLSKNLQSNEDILGQMLSCCTPADPDKWRKPAMNLTERQEKVLEMIQQGVTLKQISRAVFMSHSSIDKMLIQMRRKYGATNSKELADMWLQWKIA